MPITANRLWESLSPEQHDEAARFWTKRAAETRKQHRPGDDPAVTDNIEAYAVRHEDQAALHQAEANRKRSQIEGSSRSARAR